MFLAVTFAIVARAALVCKLASAQKFQELSTETTHKICKDGNTTEVGSVQVSSSSAYFALLGFFLASELARPRNVENTTKAFTAMPIYKLVAQHLYVNSEARSIYLVICSPGTHNGHRARLFDLATACVTICR